MIGVISCNKNIVYDSVSFFVIRNLLSQNVRLSGLSSFIEYRSSFVFQLSSITSFLIILPLLSKTIISRGHFLGQFPRNTFSSSYPDQNESQEISLLSGRTPLRTCHSSNIRCSFVNSLKVLFHPYAKLVTITLPMIQMSTKKAIRLILRASFFSVESGFIVVIAVFLVNEISDSFHGFNYVFSKLLSYSRYVRLQGNTVHGKLSLSHPPDSLKNICFALWVSFISCEIFHDTIFFI